ncbi:flavin reductase family protein [Paracoccus sp. FO-3]|uniref:flavin reductase family protein n=1 Tax=Paracoccus sp. FO-3 TaxID=1335059 RepID=UPI000912EE31|nr:flavin reductase family protein [Paracoccus sp. FO-3]SFY45790.1 NADH-FMN oxidoreductase RutF, flavin reductase (DIM6/NTAB) family [Paracoccus pantotrophus]
MTEPDTLAESVRFALRRLAQTVAVISMRHENRRIAMAATALNSLSLDPPAMMVAVNRTASIYPALSAGGRFCINILAEGQEAVARACGGALKGEDRFGVGIWRDLAGVPVLEGAQARLLCQQDGFMHYGSHGVFAGRVLSVEMSEEIAPLIYADSRFSGLHFPDVGVV